MHIFLFLLNIIRLIATTEEFLRVLNVNTVGVMHCFKYAALQMIKQGRGGRIIGRIISVSQQVPW